MSTPVVPKPLSLQMPTASPKRAKATLRGTRPSSQCRPDPASDLRMSPTSAQRTPSDSPPSISDRVLRLFHAIVRAAVDGGGSLPPSPSGRLPFPPTSPFPPDLDTHTPSHP